jgi:Dolichyl-phosphate-mannose-protein mannosyltransferase
MPKPLRPRATELAVLGTLGVVLVLTNPYITFIDDETSIIGGAAGPLRPMLHAFWVGEGVHEHPPLYDIVLHFWLRMTGGSFFALRIPAIVFYLIGLWLLCRAAEELGGERAARITFVLGALWPFAYHYGRLAGWYSFCFMLVAALTLAHLRLAQERTAGRRCAALILAAALIYSNYFGWAFLACLAFDFALRARAANRLFVTPLGVSAGILALVYLPLWRAFLAELHFGANLARSLKAEILWGGFHSYNLFVSESVAPWVIWLGIPACICIAACLLLTWKCSSPEPRRFLVYALVLLGVMTAIGIINSKRLLPIGAWVVLSIGLALGTMTRGIARTLLVTSLAGICLIGWFGIFTRRYYSAPRFLEPWAQVATEAATRAEHGAFVIGNNPSFFFYLRYALQPPALPGAQEISHSRYAANIFPYEDWLENGEPFRSEVFFVLGEPVPANGGGPLVARQVLDSRCRLVSEQRLLPDPAASLKSRYLPGIGELPFRVVTRDYSCASGP